MLSIGRFQYLQIPSAAALGISCTIRRDICSHTSKPSSEGVNNASKNSAPGGRTRSIVIATAQLAACTRQSYSPATAATAATSFSATSFILSVSRDFPFGSRTRTRNTIRHPYPSPTGSSDIGKAFFSTSRAVMVAQKIDGTTIAKNIRARLQAEIQERKNANPRYTPSLRIIQGG